MKTVIADTVHILDKGGCANLKYDKCNFGQGLNSYPAREHYRDNNATFRKFNYSTIRLRIEE